MAKKTKLDIHFPEEIITQMFLLLSVKTLLQCKLVCKTWLYIISNPSFIKFQLLNAIIASKNNPTLLTILYEPPYPTDSDFPFHKSLMKRRRKLLNEALLDTKAQDLSTSPVLVNRIFMPLVFEDTIVVGSCNGIICLISDFSDSGNTIYLWNPLIGTFRVILSSRNHPLKYYPVRIGFGYDCISDDYKVVRFVYDDDNVVDTVQVYSTNAKCWTTEFKVPNLKIYREERRTNIVVNGVLYFINEDYLISFDLHKEVVGQIPLPTTSLIERRSDLLDFEGSVAIVFETWSGNDLWVLEDASGQASWSKKFNMDEDPQIWIYSYLGARQFCGSKSLDRQVVLYHFLFDSKKKETKYFALGEDNLVEALKYTPTLVSLNRFGRNKLENEMKGGSHERLHLHPPVHVFYIQLTCFGSSGECRVGIYRAKAKANMAREP